MVVRQRCIIFLAAILVVVFVGVVAAGTFKGDKTNDGRQGSQFLTETEARVIAEAACIKGGEALAAGSYNQNTKTWWFDANLNATREGCNPACVVSQEAKTAEINWRCTGANDPGAAVCGIENCHGLEIVCGDKPVGGCTDIYLMGDRCRQFAECGVVNSVCRQIENSQFTTCKACVQECASEYSDDAEQALNCESKCVE